MVPFLIVVGGVTLAVLVVLLIALFSRVRALAESLARLQRDLMPLLESIQQDSERAQARLAELSRTAPDPEVG